MKLFNKIFIVILIIVIICLIIFFTITVCTFLIDDVLFENIESVDVFINGEKMRLENIHRITTYEGVSTIILEDGTEYRVREYIINYKKEVEE